MKFYMGNGTFSDVPGNVWMTAIPFSTLSDVVVLDISGDVFLGWVQGDANGLTGAGYSVNRSVRAVQCYMLIPTIDEDPRGWNNLYTDDPVYPSARAGKVIVCVDQRGGRLKLMTGEYDSKLKQEWRLNGAEKWDGDVIAWRPFPRPKKPR